MFPGERFNSWSHLIGAVLALGAATLLIVIGALRGDAWKVVSFAIYGTGLVLLYLFSTLYHSTRGRAKRVLRKFDHLAIYVLIAATYTPFALVTLRGPWGWSLFGAVWGLALLGMAQELLIGGGRRRLSMAIYLLMGWLVVVAALPLAEALPTGGLAWLVAGGVIYTAGIVFYVFDERFAHWHGIWHLFVLGGSSAHYVAVIAYVA